MKSTFLAGALFLSVYCYAQQSNVSSGGEAKSESGTVSYSVGQVFHSTISGSSGQISEGVQQPYEIFVVDETFIAPGIQLECIVYPNPTIDFLNLEIGDWEKYKLSYELIGLDGKVIDKKEIDEIKTQLDMTHIGQGSYLIRITDTKKMIKTFKIIKN